jgi:hypothetical protein
MQPLVEWLHEHPGRTVVIRPAGHWNEEGTWVARECRATFTLTTKLPDGRKVQSSVEVLDELLLEPEAGDLIVHEAKLAIDSLLAREAGR